MDCWICLCDCCFWLHAFFFSRVYNLILKPLINFLFITPPPSLCLRPPPALLVCCHSICRSHQSILVPHLKPSCTKTKNSVQPRRVLEIYCVRRTNNPKTIREKKNQLSCRCFSSSDDNSHPAVNWDVWSRRRRGEMLGVENPVSGLRPVIKKL